MNANQASPSAPKTNDKGSIEKRIRRDLALLGHSVAAVEDFDAFLRLCTSLGKVLAIHDIRHDTAALPFHTDEPYADIICWLCVEQDTGGESMLVDGREVVEALTPQDRRLLETTRVVCSDRGDTSTASTTPVLTHSEDANWRISYTPWLLAPMDDMQERAIAALERALASTEPISLRLGVGEVLFADNWRMLHGRGPLAEASRRHLKRAWIRTGLERPT